jgi:hypothetical protein
MTTANLSRLGAINAVTGSYAQDNALFLKVFSGEVLTAFQENNVFMPLHSVRTISSGKSAQFPSTWKASAAYHVPGNPILGSNEINHAETVITIDDLLISDVMIYDLDEAKNHYDVRSIYSQQLGAALAREFDKKIAQVTALAARSSARVSGAPGGSVINGGAGAATNGTTLAGLIFEAARILDEKDVPENERVCVVRPQQYYALVQATDNINKDWGGLGAYSEGTVLKIGGIPIIKSNNVPNGVVDSREGERNVYAGDFTNTQALVFHKSAVGTVKLMDLSTEMSGADFHIMYQGTLMVGKYAMGHGVLRPEAAVEITSAAG